MHAQSLLNSEAVRYTKVSVSLILWLLYFPGHCNSSRESQHDKVYLDPILGSSRERPEGQVVAVSLPVCVGRSGTKRSRTAIPWEGRQQRARPKAFSKDQGLLENDKLTLEAV